MVFSSGNCGSLANDNSSFAAADNLPDVPDVDLKEPGDLDLPDSEGGFGLGSYNLDICEGGANAPDTTDNVEADDSLEPSSANQESSSNTNTDLPQIPDVQLEEPGDLSPTKFSGCNLGGYNLSPNPSTPDISPEAAARTVVGNPSLSNDALDFSDLQQADESDNDKQSLIDLPDPSTVFDFEVGGVSGSVHISPSIGNGNLNGGNISVDGSF